MGLKPIGEWRADRAARLEALTYLVRSALDRDETVRELQPNGKATGWNTSMLHTGENYTAEWITVYLMRRHEEFGYSLRFANEHTYTAGRRVFREQPDIEFPQWLQDLGFTDMSYCNDCAARAHRPLNAEVDLLCWCNFPEVDDREMGKEGTGLFYVETVLKDETEPVTEIYDGESAADAANAIQALLEAHGAPLEPKPERVLLLNYEVRVFGAMAETDKRVATFNAIAHSQFRALMAEAEQIDPGMTVVVDEV